MAIERSRPFGALVERDPCRDIQNEMNRLFENFLGRATSTAPMGGRAWTPVVDVYETKDDLVLSFELPGVPEKDISLSITGDVLTLRGERHFNQQGNDGDRYVQTERVYGKFERSIRLPMPVQSDRVRATYRDGVLEVSLPKADEVRPKEIKIDVL